MCMSIVLVSILSGCTQVKNQEFEYSVDPNIGEGSVYGADSDSVMADSDPDVDSDSVDSDSSINQCPTFNHNYFGFCQQ